MDKKDIRAPSTMDIIAIILIITYCYINLFQNQMPTIQDMNSPVMLVLGYYFGASIIKKN